MNQTFFLDWEVIDFSLELLPTQLYSTITPTTQNAYTNCLFSSNIISPLTSIRLKGTVALKDSLQGMLTKRPFSGTAEGGEEEDDEKEEEAKGGDDDVAAAVFGGDVDESLPRPSASSSCSSRNLRKLAVAFQPTPSERRKQANTESNEHWHRLSSFEVCSRTTNLLTSGVPARK
jgi:hypothetical protein